MISGQEKLETQIKAIEDPEIGLCWGKAGMADDKGNLIILRLKIGVMKIFLRQRKDSLLAIDGFKQPPKDIVR